MAQPIVQGGVFSTQDAYGVSKKAGNKSWLHSGPHSQDTIAPNLAHAGSNNNNQGRDVQAEETYPLGQYWNNVQMLHDMNKVEEDVTMEGQDERYDAHGVRLPDPVRPLVEGHGPNDNASGKKENIRTLFDGERHSVESDFSPMGLVSEDGLQFRLVFPPGELGKKLLERLTDISFIIRPATIRFRSRIEHQMVVSWVLPTPIHVSPLAMALARARDPAERFTDAISSACRLRVIRDSINELDTAIPEHKQKCAKFYSLLAEHVSAPYYREVDRMCNAMNELIANAKANSNNFHPTVVRDTISNAVCAFGQLSDEFALAYVHTLEWTICDLLRIPYKLRHLLMTPRMLPHAGKALSPVSFSVLRTNLCNYVKDRNLVFCAHYDEEQKRYTHIREDAWNPMNLDEPPLDTRLVVLKEWLAGTKEAQLYGAKCLYGLHNDWIDLHTLKQYMYMLSTDLRKPFAAPKTKEEEEEDQTAEGASIPMDEGQE